MISQKLWANLRKDILAQLSVHRRKAINDRSRLGPFADHNLREEIAAFNRSSYIGRNIRQLFHWRSTHTRAASNTPPNMDVA